MEGQSEKGVNTIRNGRGISERDKIKRDNQ